MNDDKPTKLGIKKFHSQKSSFTRIKSNENLINQYMFSLKKIKTVLHQSFWLQDNLVIFSVIVKCVIILSRRATSSSATIIRKYERRLAENGRGCRFTSAKVRKRGRERKGERERVGRGLAMPTAGVRPRVHV